MDEDETRPFVVIGIDCQRPAQADSDRPGNRQSQACPGDKFIHLCEAVENDFLLIQRNAASRIGDGKNNLPILPVDTIVELIHGERKLRKAKSR